MSDGAQNGDASLFDSPTKGQVLEYMERVWRERDEFRARVAELEARVRLYEKIRPEIREYSKLYQESMERLSGLGE